MRIYYKKHYTEVESVEISMEEVNLNFNGDILEAVKFYGDKYISKDELKYEILDYDLSEKEMNYKKVGEYIEKNYENINRKDCEAIDLIYEGMKELKKLSNSDGRVKF